MSINYKITYRQKIKIKRLYMQEGLQPSEISELTGINPRAITQYVYKQGLSKKRKELDERVDQVTTLESGILKEQKDFAEVIAIRSQEMVMKGFDEAEIASDGKEFAGYANGTRNFYDIYRKAQGLDGQLANAVNIGIKIVCDQPISKVEAVNI